MNKKGISKKVSLDKINPELREYYMEALINELNRKQVNMSHKIDEQLGVSMYAVSPKKRIGTTSEVKQTTVYFMGVDSDEERRMSNLYRMYKEKELKGIKNIMVASTIILIGGAMALSHNSPKGKIKDDLWLHNIGGFTASMERTVKALPEHECVIGGEGLEGVENAAGNIVEFMTKKGYSKEDSVAYADKLESSGKLDFIEKGIIRRN